MFRSLETLAQKAGVPTLRLDALAVKELVDNALDAGASVKLFATPDGFIVQDDGPGIPGNDSEIADLFSFGRAMTSSKLRLPTRGMLGNGIRVVAGLVYCAGGSIIVRTRGRSLLLEPQEDGSTTFEPLGTWNGGGTEIEIAGVLLDSTMATPALLVGHKGSKYAGKPSAFWYSTDAFYELLRATARPLRDVITRLDGCARYSLPGDLKGRRANEVTKEEARQLLSALRAVANRVNPERLGFIGEELLPGASYARATTTFNANSCEIPAVVECWASGTERFPVPLLVNRTASTLGVEVWNVDKEIRFYADPLFVQTRTPRDTRLNVTVSVIAPYIPLLSDGKHPDLCVLDASIEDVFKRAVAKAVGRPARGVRKTQKDVVLESLDTAIEKVSSGGKYRFSIRNLFYEMRPVLISVAPKGRPDYGTFADIVAAEEERRGSHLPGMYRDPRGSLYVPHTEDPIPLGTMTVEAYKHPAWTFSKVLYTEKEGLGPILHGSRFAERFDCAIVSSKGYSTSAARDVISLMVGRDVQAFCIHDADAAGTMIFEKLQEAVPGIIDLGLIPAEGIDMGLQVESFPCGKKRLPVARSYPMDVRGWLQVHRIELNAMRPEVFLAWLEGKLAPYHTKLVPPQEVLAPAFREAAVEATAHRLREEILREARFEERLEKALASLKEPEDLPEIVRHHLSANPERSWREVVQSIGKEIA